MSLLERESDPVIGLADTGEEALIKEARRLRHRRWFFGFTLAALAVGAAAAGYIAASGPPSGTHHGLSNGSSAAGSSVLAAHAFVPTRSPDLIQPTTLATLPDGNLLILDSSRDQILELEPGGRLSVFAGDGHLGFSGDGGQASAAELDLTYSTGMAVTPDGSVDVLDDGSCRIRAISPNGVIRTILRIPLIKVQPHGTDCPVAALAVSRTGDLYLAINSEIERVSANGRLVWVAGARRSDTHAPTDVTASHLAFFPSALAFNRAGDLYIWNFSPKVIFQLTPTGKITDLGVSYATQLTSAPNGTVLAGTHDGEIQEVTPTSVRPFYDVNPTRVTGIDWGRNEGFQEDGIAVTKNGTVYTDNAGSGFGLATVLVRISPAKHAALVSIHTPLTATLPKLDAPGFPASLYPTARASRGSALLSCPSGKGLERFTRQAVAQATKIAKAYESGPFASDIAVTDRSWWTADFNRVASADIGGRHTVTDERPTSHSPAAAGLAQACGQELVEDSIAVMVGKSAYSDLTGTIYFLDRGGHPLVYDVR